MEKTGFGIPFRINEIGQVATATGDENIRAKIMQVLFTSPGERMNLPEFGCGLRDLVFDPNNEILAATMEFTITKALQHWLGEEIIVEGVRVSNGATDPQVPEAELRVEVAFIRRDRMQRSKIKIAF